MCIPNMVALVIVKILLIVAVFIGKMTSGFMAGVRTVLTMHLGDAVRLISLVQVEAIR